MVETSDLMDYIDRRVCLDLFGTPYPSQRYSCSLDTPHRIFSGSVGHILADERDRQMKGLKKNRFVAKEKRRDYLSKPEVQQKIGEELVREYLKYNSRCDLGISPSSPNVTDLIKDALCIGKRISPVREEDRIRRGLLPLRKAVVERFEKLRTEIVCGTVDKPAQAMKEFVKEIKEGAWVSSLP